MINIYFVYYKYINRNKENVSKIIHNIKWEPLRQINIKNRTYYFHNDITDFEDFKSNLLKIDKK